MEQENVPKRGMGLGGVILIIIIVIIVLTGIAIAAIYLYNSKYKNQSSSEEPEDTTITPILEDESTWTKYTRAGEYSIQMPPILIRPGNDTNLEEESSFSRSGDPGVDENGSEPATLDPDLYSTIWSAQNTQNLTAEQAVEEEKANIISFPTNSLQTIKEGAITISGNQGYQGVWSYTDQNTQLSHVYAVAATAKSGKVYYISFTISSKTSAGALRGWNQYSYLFDKMISAFIFL